MVEAQQTVFPELTEELEYRSMVTDDLLVMGTEDMEAFDKLKAETTKKLIGTHSDTFHCDEVMACVMLLQTREFANSSIVRTRQDDVFDLLDIVVDVGGVFDVERNRFDHHMASFKE